VLLAGLVLRELFSAWTGHPYDMESWIRTGHAVATGENPYSGFWPAVPGVSFAYLSSTIPPAAYLPFWSGLLGVIYRFWELTGGGNRFFLYALIKQPGIWADVASAYLIYRLVERWTSDTRAAFAALAFWSYFPYAITISAIWGQFDPVVVVILLGLLYARDTVQRNVLNGLGILVKWVTVVFLPLDFFRERKARRLGFLIAPVLAGAVTLAILLGTGWSIGPLSAASSSQSHGGGLGMNYVYVLTDSPVAGVLGSIPFLYTALSYAWAVAAVVGGWIAARWVRSPDPRQELRAMLLLVSLFLLLRWGLYEHYMLYLFAPLTLDVAAFHASRRPLYYLTVILSGAYLLVNNDFGLRFISPIDPGILTFTNALDASAGWGGVRADALLVLSVLVTITLIQWVRTFLRDDARPRPWMLLRFRDLRAGSRSDPTS
jgi:hypothetical protein